VLYVDLVESVLDYLRKAVRKHEVPALLLALAYFFCVLAAYYVLRPVRDQLSAAAGGSSVLPLFYGVVFVVTLLLTPAFGGLVARFSRRRFIPIVYLFFLLGMVAFVPFFQNPDLVSAKILGTVFFVWVSVFNLFVVSVFWSFMADLFDPEQSHRLFPVIAVGGTLGAICGPAMTKALAEIVGVAGLLGISAGLLGVCIACMFGLSRWSQKFPVSGDERRDERVIGGSFIAGAKQTLASPLLRRVALLMLLGDCVGTVVYAMLSDYNRANFSVREDGVAFAAGVDLWGNLLTAIFQISLTRFLLTRYGPVSALVTDGILKALVLFGLILFGNPWIAAVAIVSRASAYGVFKPAADSLYTQVDAETRYKAKNFIDTAVWRFGDVVITNAFSWLTRLGMAAPGFAALTMLAAMGSSWIGFRVTRVLAKPASKTDG